MQVVCSGIRVVDVSNVLPGPSEEVRSDWVVVMCSVVT